MKPSEKNKPGSIDTSLSNFDLDFNINAIIPLPDNKLIVENSFGERSGVYCLSPDGSVEEFSKTKVKGFGTFNSFLLLPDGKILFCNCSDGTGSYPGGLYRYYPDGNIDESFKLKYARGSDEPDAFYYALAALPDGRIIVGGEISVYDRRIVDNIICLHPDGEIDRYFTTEGRFEEGSKVSALAVLPDGRILAGGNFNEYYRDLKNSQTTYNGIICFEYDGMLDESFAVEWGFTYDEDCDEDFFDIEVKAFAVQPDGRILAVGGFVEYEHKSSNRIVRLHPNGKLDTSFNIGTGFNNATSNVALLPDGRILVLGRFTEYNGIPCKHIACLHPDGSLDNSFNVGNKFNGNILSFAVLPNNRVILGGDFTEYDGVSCNKIACLYI